MILINNHPLVSKLAFYCLPFMLLLFMYSCGTNNIKVGENAPNFKTSLVDASEFSLSNLSGNYVLIDFWASWCAPCLRGRKALVDLYKNRENFDLPNGIQFQIVSIALEKKEGSSKKVSLHFGMNWLYQIEEVAQFVRFANLASLYKVTSIPAKFLIGPKGNIILVNPDIEEIRSHLQSIH